MPAHIVFVSKNPESTPDTNDKDEVGIVYLPVDAIGIEDGLITVQKHDISMSIKGTIASFNKLREFINVNSSSSSSPAFTLTEAPKENKEAEEEADAPDQSAFHV